MSSWMQNAGRQVGGAGAEETRMPPQTRISISPKERRKSAVVAVGVEIVVDDVGAVMTM